MTVACVLKSGGLYDKTHVDRLDVMVRGHLSAPHRFVCVEDSPWPGWWAKVSLFEPGRFAGRVLYLDLDVTVVGDLEPLAHYPAPFAIIKDWNRPGFNSSVMAWDAGVGAGLWAYFDESAMARLPGDQDWITERMPGAAIFPKPWCVSYKRHVRPFGHVKPDTRVIVYHGLPKPWDVEA